MFERHRPPLLVQTWPALVPPDRSFVRDRHFELALIADHDNTPVRERLANSDAAGVLLLEWDLAVSRDDLVSMRTRAEAHPGQGFVAPYLLYRPQRWAHGILGPNGPRPVSTTDRFCTLPCFGCIYLPRDLLLGWQPTFSDHRLTDTNFAAWSEAKGHEWPILWDHRPVHLHY